MYVMNVHMCGGVNTGSMVAVLYMYVHISNFGELLNVAGYTHFSC